MADPVAILSSVAPGFTPAGRLRAQAEELESVFLNTLTKEMFSGIGSKGAFGGGFAEQTWRSMQSEQLAGVMAAAGGIGLADQLVRDLMILQEANNKGVPQ